MNNKKKLLIFQPAIGSYRVDYFNKLSNIFSTSIFIEQIIHDSTIYDAIESINKLCITPILLRKFIKIGKRQLFLGYYNALKNIQPDIVIVSEFGLGAISAIIYRVLHKKKLKILSLCDDSFHMLSSNWNFSKFHKIARKIIVPLIDDIILAEPEAKEWYQRHYNKGIFFPIVSDEARVRKEYEKALPISREYVKTFDLEGKTVFLYVGRLVEIKNIDTLINVFNKAGLKDAKLIIVGSGDQEKKLHIMSNDNPDIIFTGRLTGYNLSAWYNIADALILPSKIEPFGAVTNEALIGGCKVLISQNAGSKCLVENDVNGNIFNPYDENELLLKLREFYKTNRNNNHGNLTFVRNTLMQKSFYSFFSDLLSQLKVNYK